MRMSNICVLFILIMFPFFWINELHADEQKNARRLELRYNAALDAAVQDAAKSLIQTEQEGDGIGYQSSKHIQVNREEAMQTFNKTLYINFGIQDDEVAKQVLHTYIPVVLVIGYDGYYVYAEDEYISEKGEMERKKTWSIKKPYVHTDALGNMFSFTLDEYVKIYNPTSRTWMEGIRQELQNREKLPLLHDAETFDSVRRFAIISALQKELETQINRYNAYLARIGAAYTFTLPTISHEDWNNTVDDVGLLAFMQGIPVGTQRYNHFAFSGSRIVKKPLYYGFLKDGIKIVTKETCGKPDLVEEVFSSNKEAAFSGYIPKSCINQK
ncbi:hypothetical protein B7C51_20955 [Paenibacillus larvae subsp. pulvifaciens]|uniref:F0F1-type ATP synthase n=1 Tax=Paenibacillus larvae subsp. pulvifaciens TaxID=1477 RepID=A0A1V0UXV0_9BACL|nr:hypothetical protein [Paenibacillus larvae]ARF69780.1 hypothetical protein B7C51_20955 [Paenibacillus larvae subsp. pulvifaciens]